LLFHPDPEHFVTGAFVKIGFFDNDADLRYQDEVHGDVFSQVTQTIEVLKAKYLKAWISYEGLHRIETYPVPEAALREAVLNAVVHKDYASAVPIQISVYADKLMIWNAGQLPPDWTVKKLLSKHASQPFNPDVARVFFRAGLIEAWGRGFERILAECRAAGAPVPEVRYETSGLWMVFPFARVADPVTDPVDRLLGTLAGDAQAPSAIQRRLGLKHRPSFRENYLRPALQEGLVELTLPENPNSRLQRYRLTDAGRARLEKLSVKAPS
jgi:ATP-dependent DNA helicase RecG